MANDDVVESLDNLNNREETAIITLKQPVMAALAEAISNDRAALRWFLVEKGYLDDEHVSESSYHNRSPASLTEFQKQFKECLDNLEEPKTASEIVEYVTTECPTLVESFRSVQNRGYVSRNLNELAKEGYLGRYREGREVKFTPDTTLAVRNWAISNGKYPEQLSYDEIDEITDETNMPPRVVQSAIQELRSS